MLRCDCRRVLSCKSSPAAAEWGDSGGGGGRSSRGQTPPPAPAAAVSAGQEDSHTPLVGPTWLLCGSPAAVYSPPAGGTALHCNIPEHRDTVSVRTLNQAFLPRATDTYKPEAEQEIPEKHKFSFTLMQISQKTQQTFQKC